MRRLVFPAIAAIGLVMVGPSSAFAEDPAPTVSVKATPGKKMCKITDPKLDEVSGLVATKSGYVVVDDSSLKDSHKKIFFLDQKCNIVDEKSYSGRGPRDTEDLILSPDGKTLWIADIGDNNYAKDDGTRRESISVWKMPLDGSTKPKLYRMAYPQGDYHDAEALLLTGNGIPLVITKELGGKPAGIYQPTAALKADSETGVPLKRMGELTVAATETPAGPLARIGKQTIDGGAIAPGGGRVVLRTYTDALEWDVTGNDVLTALKSKPRTTGLPNEPSGEAITYSTDGKTFLTVSDVNGVEDVTNNILQYTPATTVATVKKGSTGGGAGGSGTAWYADLTINQITMLVGGVGVLGLILVAIGVFGIRGHRKRLRDAPPAYDDDAADDLPGDPETELLSVGGPPQRPVYGGARSGPAAPAGGSGVYGGAKGGGAPRGNGVYGGSGPQYARQPGEGAQPGPKGTQPRGPQQPGRNGVYGAPGGGGQPPRAPGGGQPSRAPGGGKPSRAPGGGGQPPRAPGGGQPSRAPGGGQPSRAPGGGQPPRGPQGGGGAPGGGGQPYGQPRGPQQGQRPQGGGGQPRGPQGQGQRPQGGGQPRGGPQGMYGQPGGRPDGGGGRPPQRGGDGHTDRNGRPEGRFDNPGYRR
jgi:hypothetical protein